MAAGPQLTGRAAPRDGRDLARLGDPRCYVDHVRGLARGWPLPTVYRDEELLAGARDLRATLGEDAFAGGLLPNSEWSEINWDTTSLDAALTAPRGDQLRKRLVGERSEHVPLARLGDLEGARRSLGAPVSFSARPA